MLSKTDPVEVLYGDLEETHKVLGTCYNFLLSQDLTKQYSLLRNKTTESPLTEAVKQSRDRVFGLMLEAQQNTETDDEEEVDEQSYT